MDWAAFEKDVWDSVNNTLYTEQWGSLDDSGDEFTGVVVTMGETWLGALYIAEEFEDGFKYVHRYDTEEMQREYFERVAE